MNEGTIKALKDLKKARDDKERELARLAVRYEEIKERAPERIWRRYREEMRQMVEEIAILKANISGIEGGEEA